MHHPEAALQAHALSQLAPRVGNVSITGRGAGAVITAHAFDIWIQADPAPASVPLTDLSWSATLTAGEARKQLAAGQPLSVILNRVMSYLY